MWNMKALCLIVQKLLARLKFFPQTGQTDMVNGQTGQITMMPTERSVSGGIYM